MGSRAVWYIAALLVASVVGCASDPPPPLEPIKVGVLTAFSGGLSTSGKAIANSVGMAAQEFKAGGGLLDGRPLEIISRDTETDEDVAAEAAEELANEGVVGIIGPLDDSASLEVIARLKSIQANIPIISPASSSPQLNSDRNSEAHQMFFRTVPSDEIQGEIFARIAAGNYPDALSPACESLVIVHLSNDYGRNFFDEINGAYGDLDREISGFYEISDGRTSYDSVVEDLIDDNPDCIGLVAYESGGVIVRDWYEFGGADTVRWIATDGARAEGFIDNCGGNAEGIIGTAPIISPNTGEYGAFAENYQFFFSEAPRTFSSSAYDAMALLGLAVVRAQSTNGESIALSLRRVSSGNDDAQAGPGQLIDLVTELNSDSDVNYQGASGSVDLDRNGDVEANFEIWEIASGDFERVQSVRPSDL